MNIKTKAALYTLSFISIPIVMSLCTIWLASMVSPVYIFYAILSVLGLALIYVIYRLMLQRLEHFEIINKQLQNMDDRLKKY